MHARALTVRGPVAAVGPCRHTPPATVRRWGVAQRRFCGGVQAPCGRRAPPLPVAVPRDSLPGPAPSEGQGGLKSIPLVGPLLAHVAGLFNVFSDERCNSKLLALAIGQMLCSVATLIHDSYLPVYVHDELGLSTTKIGAVQGAAQFLCQLSKGVSGVVGDVLGSQVRVLVFGTFLTVLCKPMFVLLSSVYGAFGLTACLYWFFSAKLLDRLSKGIREAPTKAVMNELAKEAGDAPDAAYGLRQSLATAGMLIGSTVAAVTFAATSQNYVLTFALATVPAAVALLWLMQNFQDELFGAKPPVAAAGAAAPAPQSASLQSTSVSSLSSVADDTTAVRAAPAPSAAPEPQLSPLQKAWAVATAFKPVYWQALAVVAVLYFARFDASFLSLRAKAVMPTHLLPLLTLINSLLQVVLTAPLAKVSGRGVATRNKLLLAGFVSMIAADACFALPALATPAGMFAGAALIGVHMAMTHAITISMVASYMPTGYLAGVGKLSGSAVSFTDLLLGGAAACALSGVLLLLFERFGDLGKDELVMTKAKKQKAA